MGASLAKEIEKQKKKDVVDLRKRGIQELPTAVGVLLCKELILAENDISTIPGEIGSLRNLTLLDFSSNRVNALPVELAQLRTLQTLVLANNKLFFATHTLAILGKLSALQKLDLSNNQLDELPPELFDLKELQTLNLSKNQLKLLAPDIGEDNGGTKRTRESESESE